jgi:hypothetical protein
MIRIPFSSRDTRHGAYFSVAAGRPKGRGISSFNEGLPPLGAEDNRMDVVAWLRGLGLEQYAPAFSDNDIDGDLVRRLTAEDLRELGVASVGHRRRLLDAIAAFDAPAPAADASGLAAETIATLAPKGDAERRQLTVMFCDLVGSTALSARLDPEDLRGIIGAYHRCVTETVDGFSGYVARYMGDGVLVYLATRKRMSTMPSAPHDARWRWLIVCPS